MANKPEENNRAHSAAADAGQSPVAGSSRLARVRPLLRWPYLLVFAAVTTAISAGIISLTRPPETHPENEFQTALKYLDQHRDKLLQQAPGGSNQNHGASGDGNELLVSAKRIAQALQDRGYQDRSFQGGLAFVLGICAFRDAVAFDDVRRDQRFMAAASLLREVEHQAIPEERRPEWAFAAGISLYRIGRADEAQPLLKEAVETYPPGKNEASLLLTQIYMDGRSKHNMELALALNSKLLEDAGLPSEDRDTAWLQRAQILLALDRRDESEEALEQVSSEGDRSNGSRILQAQTKMADGKYQEAIEILKPLSGDVGLQRVYPAQANYLMGVCAEQLGELENAVAYYQRTAERFGQSHEAVAARLGGAAALRKLGRNEEALDSYAQVLRSVSRPRGFRNRWISLRKLQETVLEAWNAWMEHHFYDEAITLAEMMSPAVPREQSIELVARANQRWAQHLEAEIGRLAAEGQIARREELHSRWRRAGQAYARLSENCRSTVDYHNALWTSAEDFVKGHDFANAIENLNQFIDNRLSNLLPLALVRRGQCYMNLARLDDAMRDFQDAISNNPTDPIAFQARYLIGQCHLERDEIGQAELSWRKILDSHDLTPTAIEWRTALYSLGKLLYDTADQARRQLKQRDLANQEVNTEQQAALMARFDDAILRLEEFRDRYPNAAETVEVRFLLAQALQKSAEFPELRWRHAETDNARNEFRRQMQERLERGIRELQQLQIVLQSLQTSGQLDEAGQAMLRNCFFEIANCLFLLERYDAAIAAYSTSAGRYQQEPDSLIAYVQIANCYDHMEKPADALSTLAQALLILKQLPDEAFSVTPSSKSRDDWKRWLDWAMKLHH
jgi:tetratricopeptide (TPR) repeat protein